MQRGNLRRLSARFRDWRDGRRKRAWDDACWNLRIPHDVRRRMEKMDPDHRNPPTWYAGRQVQRSSNDLKEPR